MSFTNTLTRYDAELVDLLARRPELRDVGIAGYLAGAAVDGAPGMPPTFTFDGAGAVIVHRPDVLAWSWFFSGAAA